MLAPQWTKLLCKHYFVSRLTCLLRCLWMKGWSGNWPWISLGSDDSWGSVVEDYASSGSLLGPAAPSFHCTGLPSSVPSFKCGYFQNLGMLAAYSILSCCFFTPVSVLQSWLPFLLKSYQFLFSYVFIRLYVCALNAWLLLAGARRGCHVPWNWSYRQL